MSRRVLVVDNDRETRALFRKFLEFGGYEVSEAASGAEAVTAMESGLAFDLLQTDIEVPNGHAMDGMALARTARHNHPDLPILIVSDPVDLGSRTSWLAKPCQVMGKPVSQGELLDVVGRMFDSEETLNLLS